MTSFERQVALVLREHIRIAKLPHDGWYQPLADMLARQVAAAIEAAHGSQRNKARELLQRQ